MVVSGTPVRRPVGQLPRPDGPVFAPSERLDIELKLGFITGGPPTPLGEPLPIARAGERIFGFVLVNDWSARDIQRWEYQPLGPFLGKSFATSVSAWVVPAEALAARRVAGPAQVPAPLPHLRRAEDWSLHIDLSVELGGTVISRGNGKGLYWDSAQQLAHAASNGAVIGPGDLYASGTISGAEPGTEGSLIELTRKGEAPVTVAGAQRTFLEDGDTVVLRGVAGDVRLGDVAREAQRRQRDRLVARRRRRLSCPRPACSGCAASGSGLGTTRWVVERSFAHLHNFRRLRIRYERHPEMHEAFLVLGLRNPLLAPPQVIVKDLLRL